MQVRNNITKADASKDLPEIIEKPYISQIIAFDVLYDETEAKEELKYLFKIIDLFDMSDQDKKSFLQEILQYWILSVKDYKWHEERERRYVLFLYDEYTYKEIEFDESFLKIKTSLFLTPDFIIGDNPARQEITKQLAAKRKALFRKEYMFCENCLMQDFDAPIMHMPKVCPICGSSNVKMIYDKEQL